MQHETVCGGCVSAFVHWLQTGKRQTNCSSCEVNLEYVANRFLKSITGQVTTATKAPVKPKRKTAAASSTSLLLSDIEDQGTDSEAVHGSLRDQGKEESLKSKSTTISTANHHTTEKYICNTCEGLFKYKEPYCYQRSSKKIRRTHLDCLNEDQIALVRALAVSDPIDFWAKKDLTEQQAKHLRDLLEVKKDIGSVKTGPSVCDDDEMWPTAEPTTIASTSVQGLEPVRVSVAIPPPSAVSSNELDVQRLTSIAASAKSQHTKGDHVHVQSSFLRQTPLDVFVSSCGKASRSTIEDVTILGDSGDSVGVDKDADIPFVSQVRPAQTPKQTPNRCQESESYLQSVKNSYRTSRNKGLDFGSPSVIKPPLWLTSRDSHSDDDCGDGQSQFCVQIDPCKAGKQSFYSMQDNSNRATAQSVVRPYKTNRKRRIQDSSPELEEVARPSSNVQSPVKERQYLMKSYGQSSPIELDRSPAKRPSLASDRERSLVLL